MFFESSLLIYTHTHTHTHIYIYTFFFSFLCLECPFFNPLHVTSLIIEYLCQMATFSQSPLALEEGIYSYPILQMGKVRHRPVRLSKNTVLLDGFFTQSP